MITRRHPDGTETSVTERPARPGLSIGWVTTPVCGILTYCLAYSFPPLLVVCIVLGGIAVSVLVDVLRLLQPILLTITLHRQHRLDRQQVYLMVDTDRRNAVLQSDALRQLRNSSCRPQDQEAIVNQALTR
jgi:hypothetical protein